MPDLAQVTQIHFLRPWWLAGILAAALLHLALRRRYRAERQWRDIVAPHLLAHLVVHPARNAWLSPRHLLAATLCLACIALAGPAWERERPPFVEDRAPLVIAIDLSPSMNATDNAPTRLERAKQKVRDFLALRTGARTALVAYAGDAHAVLPLTDDPKILTAYVEALQTDLMPVPGRKPVAALAKADELLAAESVPGSILFVTDGFPGAELPEFAARAKAGRNGIVALVLGTPEGGPVRTGPARYATTATGQRVVARVDIAELEAMADATDATLVRATLDRGDVERIQRNVQTRLEQAIEQSALTRWRDAGYYLTIPVLLLLAPGFRRGWTVRW